MERLLLVQVALLFGHASALAAIVATPEASSLLRNEVEHVAGVDAMPPSSTRRRGTNLAQAAIALEAKGAMTAVKGVTKANAVEQKESHGKTNIVLNAIKSATKTAEGEKAKAAERDASVKHAITGGIAGMIAGAIQVICLMWMRTVMNYQYFHGGTLWEAMKTMWAEGGIPRFYRGLSFALMQVPIARFGDTFAQTMVYLIFGSPGKEVHGVIAGAVVATIGALCRLMISPLDTMKLNAQVHGGSAAKIMTNRVREGGIRELWSGSFAMFAVIWIGSFPWWATYNLVMQYWAANTPWQIYIRNAAAGILASMASDLSSNALRILKVKRQAASQAADGVGGYINDIKEVIAKDGLYGMFFRGLGTKMLAGAIQGAFFAVFWNWLLVKMELPVGHHVSVS